MRLWKMAPILAGGILLAGCAADGPPPDDVLTLGAFTSPREAYRRILPLFQEHWRKSTGRRVAFRESYLGSGAQARAVIGGFEADVVALSLEGDIDKIRKAGLIRAETKSATAATTVIAIAVRKGNPRGIRDWGDLGDEGNRGDRGLEILMPDPMTSGGAQWIVLAICGAANRGRSVDADVGKFLKGVLRNVTVLDKGARESITNFERGLGDAAITYENEVWAARAAGMDYDAVIPSSTVLVENPAAIVDTYVDRHGTREAAEAFVAFLRTSEAQQAFAEAGYRPVDPAVAMKFTDRYPAVKDLWRIEDRYPGGWAEISKNFFGPEGIYTKAAEAVYAGLAH